MKNKFKIMLLIAAIALLLGSCTSIDIESQVTDHVVAITPIPDEIDHKIVGSFREELRVYFTVNGLIPVSRLEIDKTVRQAIQRYKGDGVANLHVNDQYGGIDILIQMGLGVGGYLLGYFISPDPKYAGVTGSLGASTAQFFLQSRTVTVSGDVFKLE